MEGKEEGEKGREEESLAARLVGSRALFTLLSLDMWG